MSPITVRPWFLIVAGILLVGVTILLVLTFSGTRKPDNDAYKQQAALTKQALDIISRQQEDNAVLRDRIIEDKDAAKQTADSLLNVVLNNKPKYITVNNGYKQVKPALDRISGDDAAINRALSDY